MSSQTVVERERSRALPTALASFFGIGLFIAAGAFGAISAALLNQDLVDTETLLSFEDDRGELLIGTIMQSAGLLLVAVPLFFLFQAAAARSESVRQALIGVTVAGPLFLAASGILAFVALDGAATDLAAPSGGLGVPSGEYVDQLLEDQFAYGSAQGLGLAGTLGLVFAIVYTSLHAMRVGLLTRFWGTLGMALGVSILFLGLFGVLIFILALGLLIVGVWPGGRPPAWEQGRAVPWPAPGERADHEEDSDRPAEPDEFAATIEGSGAEVAGGSEDPGSAATDLPRKRKRRG